MSLEFGYLSVTGNATAVAVESAAAAYTTGWAVGAVAEHGGAAVTPTAATGKLVLKPGVYRVFYQLSLEGQQVSATSGDAIGDITAAVYYGGTLVAGSKSILNTVAANEMNSLSGIAYIEVTPAEADAGTNYAQIYLKSGDASGNDVLVKEAQFEALKIG